MCAGAARSSSALRSPGFGVLHGVLCHSARRSVGGADRPENRPERPANDPRRCSGNASRSSPSSHARCCRVVEHTSFSVTNVRRKRHARSRRKPPFHPLVAILRPSRITSRYAPVQPAGEPNEPADSLHRPDRAPPPAPSDRGGGDLRCHAAFGLRVDSRARRAWRRPEAQQGRTRPRRRGRADRRTQGPVGTRRERRTPCPGHRRDQFHRSADDRPALVRAEPRRLGACRAPGGACNDGADQGEPGQGPVGAQRRGRRLAEPRHTAHRQHARIHHRRADEQRAQRQHQDRLQRLRRQRHRHCRARFRGHEGARRLPERQRRDPRQAQRQHAEQHRGQLGHRCQQHGFAAARQHGAQHLRGRDRCGFGGDTGRLRPRHPCRIGGGRLRQVLRRGHARHHRHRAQRQPLRRQGAQRAGHGQRQRCPRRHPVGDLPRQGIQHPRAQPEPGRRLHGDVADRPAVRRGAQRHRGRHHGGGGRGQLRP